MFLRSAMAGIALTLVQVPSVEAAVRVCRGAVTSGPQVGATLAEGQKQALEAWTKAAGLAGPRYAAWRLATTKSISCQPLTEHRIVCVARANPCAIEQVPPPSLAPVPKSPHPRVSPRTPTSPGANQLNI